MNNLDAVYQSWQNQAQAYDAQSPWLTNPPRPRDMIAADLGIIDELLDEKVGLDGPGNCVCDRVNCFECHQRWLRKHGKPNPLDGTRLWDNSDD